jgi:hypothetical protein
MNEYQSYLRKLISDCLTPQKSRVKFDKSFWTKFTLILIATTFIVVNTMFGLVLPDTKVATIRDKTFELTEPVNRYLQNHRTVLHMMLIFSSLCIDTVVFSIFIYWVGYGKSWRIFFSCAIFYIFRGFIQVNYTNLEHLSGRVSRRLYLGISRFPIIYCLLFKNK